MQKHDNEEIKRSALEAIETEITLLRVSERLCGSFTDLIAAKYNLHGTIPKAINTLKCIAKEIKKRPASDQMTSEILGRNEREELHLEQSNKDPYHVAIQDALNTGNYRKLNTMNIRKILRDIEIHEKKECICFSKP